MTFLLRLLAVAVLAVPALARGADPAPATAAADSDTVATLPGIFLPEGVTLDDLLPDVDWTPTTGAATDSLLRAGLGVVLAFEDTFSFDPGTVDTMLVTAPRVTIGEVIEAIGRRMEAEARAMRDVEFTTLTTVVEHDTPSRIGGDYKVTELAERTRMSPDRGLRSVRMWKRERQVKNGEVVKEDIADRPERSWDDMQQNMMMAMPFAPGSGGRYKYTITARDLVGNSLIYRIDFAPKSRFEALPTGTVWVDTGRWVIRKVEARLTDVVPFPMFLESIPVFRLSRERLGEYWFTTDVQMEVRLHKLPLLKLPRVIDLRTTLDDFLINGQPRDPDSPAMSDPGNVDPDSAGFWLSPEASQDTLRAYWDGIAEVWNDELAPDLKPVELSEAEVDSLMRVGRRELAKMAQASPWTVQLHELAEPAFNRVQGPVPRLGLTLRHRGSVRPRLDLAAGYGFGNQRPEFTARATVPLLRGADADAPMLGGGPSQGALVLKVGGWKAARSFAGDGRPGTRTVTALFAGSDPNQYFESRGARARLRWNAGAVSLWGDAGVAEERALEQTTTWNVMGRRLSPDGNLAAESLDDRHWGAGARWDLGHLALDGAWTRHDVGGFGETGGGRLPLEEVSAGVRLQTLDARGNEWVVRGRYRAFDGKAPRQWRTWLGDWGTLRGYRAAALNGDRAAWASVDLRLGVDLFRALQVPGLKSLGLQPLLFADHGQAWAEQGSLPDENQTGQLWDVGFGLGRRLDLPFAWGFPNVRAYLARPVGPGTADEGWRVLVGFEK